MLPLRAGTFKRSFYLLQNFANSMHNIGRIPSYSNKE
jgi:hypothetical protein